MSLKLRYAKYNLVVKDKLRFPLVSFAHLSTARRYAGASSKWFGHKKSRDGKDLVFVSEGVSSNSSQVSQTSQAGERTKNSFCHHKHHLHANENIFVAVEMRATFISLEILTQKIRSPNACRNSHIQKNTANKWLIIHVSGQKRKHHVYFYNRHKSKYWKKLPPFLAFACWWSRDR